MYKGFIEATKNKIDCLFQNIDRLEYLSYRNVKDNISDVRELSRTPLKPFVPAFISAEKGESWGMQGLILTFRATKEICDFFKNNIEKGVTLYGFLYLDETKKKYFENPAYYFKNKKLLSCCSHEGYEDNDKEFETALEKIYISHAKKGELYPIMRDTVAKMPVEIYKQKKKLYRIFQDLGNYIAQEQKSFIYSCPQYDCDFTKFLQYAQYVFTDDIVCELKKCKNYVDVNGILPAIEDKYYAELFYLDLVVDSKDLKNSKPPVFVINNTK